MIPTDRFKQVEVRSQAELHDWLAAHHQQAESVWLVTYLKHMGARYVSISQVLDELLCFGWVDGLRRKLDSERTMQLISPRQMQAWAQSYRIRAACLLTEGRMQAAGLAAIERAKASGQWLSAAHVDELLIPSDLLAALQAQPQAEQLFMGFAKSHRRNVLRWIASARRPATRAARIQRVAEMAALGQKVPQL